MVQSHSVLDVLAGPLVLCVGTSTDQFAAVAEATGGQVTMLYLPDAAAVRRLISTHIVGPAGGTAGQPAGDSAAAAPDAQRPAGTDQPSGATLLAAHRVVECGKLRIDADLREATWRGSVIPLSAREFDLLLALAGDPGRVWTFAELTTHVWKRPYLGDTDAVVSAVKRLRRQIRTVTGAVTVESVRGVGYRLVVAESS